QRFETGDYEPDPDRDRREAPTFGTPRQARSGSRVAGAVPPHAEPSRRGPPTSLVARGDKEPPRGPFHGVGPKGYRRSAERIREDVCDALLEADDVDAREIEVHVEGAEVTLEGTVADRHQKRMAELLTERVRGVEDVHNHLRIRRGDERTA